MKLWRLTRAPYADLNGEGALRFGGRWNSPGRAMLYTAADAALTVLEVRVHLDLPPELLPDDYVLMTINTAQSTVETGPSLTSLEASQAFGDQWLLENRSALLRVPSVIVPESDNLLLNPSHPEAKLITIVGQRPFTFDDRLFL